MTGFVWGVAVAWIVCTGYHYSQHDKDADTVAGGAAIMFILLAIVALVVSISTSSAINGSMLTPTPLLGR